MTITKNKEEIIRLLEKIIEKSTIINKYKDQIPQIEIDLILSDIRDLYERYCHLNDISEEPEILKSASAEKENNIAHEKISNEKNITVEPLKILKDEEPKEVVEQQVAKEIKTEVPVANLSFNTNQIIADKFKDDNSSINDKIALNKTDTSVASKINEHQLNDIRKGIGINDKFLFIKELFNGKSEEFDESVNNLNKFDSHTEAKEFLSSLKTKYNWEDKSEAFIAFNKLIERKFA